MIKLSLALISALAVSGCLGLTIVGGAVGMGDSYMKDMKIKKIEKKIEALEKQLEDKTVEAKPKSKPYVPAYYDMDTFNKGIYDK
mgnify:CR=1 FL=1